jgi:aminoglycoside 6-adenylyltransferase
MDALAERYARLERDFAAWAADRPDIRAGLVIGSRARTDHPADEWSDLDLLVFTADPARYTGEPVWLEQFGLIWVKVLNWIYGVDPEWLVVFDEGVKIDIAFTSISEGAVSLPAVIATSRHVEVIRRGARVLLDKTSTGSASTIEVAPRAANPLPTLAEFNAALNQTWLDVMRTAKFIKRRDLWRAKQSCDCLLKQHLLTLLEWQAQATGSGLDVWHDGRFLDEWSDGETVAALPATFATYDQADLWRALLATFDLYCSVAVKTALQLGQPYPANSSEQIAHWLHGLARD